MGVHGRIIVVFEDFLMARAPNGASVEEKRYQNHRAKPSSVVKSLETMIQGEFKLWFKFWLRPGGQAQDPL